MAHWTNCIERLRHVSVAAEGGGGGGGGGGWGL